MERRAGIDMRIHIEENDKPLTKEQVELLTKRIFCPSNPPKIATNDKGIWRRIKGKLELL